MQLTEKSNEVFELVKANNGKISTGALEDATGRTARSISANVTDLQKKGLVIRNKVDEGEGEDAKTVTYVCITEAGENFVPSDED